MRCGKSRLLCLGPRDPGQNMFQRMDGCINVWMDIFTHKGNGFVGIGIEHTD